MTFIRHLLVLSAVPECLAQLPADNTPIQLRMLSQAECCFPFLSVSISHYVSIYFFSFFSFSPPLHLCAMQEAIITGLLPETTYSLTVAAYTTKGDGARSKAKVVTTTGAGMCCLWIYVCACVQWSLNILHQHHTYSWSAVKE